MFRELLSFSGPHTPPFLSCLCTQSGTIDSALCDHRHGITIAPERHGPDVPMYVICVGCSTVITATTAVPSCLPACHWCFLHHLPLSLSPIQANFRKMVWPLSITMAVTGSLIPLPHVPCLSPASLPHTTLCSVLLKLYASSMSCVPCDPAATLEGPSSSFQSSQRSTVSSECNACSHKMSPV